MQKTGLINKLTIQRSYITFILPIGYNDGKKKDFAKTLKK